MNRWIFPLSLGVLSFLNGAPAISQTDSVTVSFHQPCNATNGEPLSGSCTTRIVETVCPPDGGTSGQTVNIVNVPRGVELAVVDAALPCGCWYGETVNVRGGQTYVSRPSEVAQRCEDGGGCHP